MKCGLDNLISTACGLFLTLDGHVTALCCVPSSFSLTLSECGLTWLCLGGEYYIHIVFHVSLSLRLPGGVRRRGWEVVMGKWASALSPPLESSLKGLER